MKKLVYFVIVFILFFASLPVYKASASDAQDRQIKVKLKQYLGIKTSITLIANGDYKTADGTILLKSGEEAKVQVESSQLVLYKGSKAVGKYGTLSITPTSQASILSINNRPYHGSFEFTVESDKYVRPINSIYIEEYLKGVVPSEMPALWHEQALKSQAIAARTYALGYLGSVIDDTQKYQVYGGTNLDGHVYSDQAVTDTTGMVLKYNNNLIDAVFSSSNGGVTELNSNAWPGSSPAPYLAIKEDSYDPKTVWSILFDKQQIDLTGKDMSKPNDWWASVNEKDSSIVPTIKKWLNDNGYKDKDIKITDIPILSFSDKTSGGRVTKGSIQVKFLVKDLVDANGALVPQTIEMTDVSASKIREILGTTKMKSYLVDEISDTTDSISIKGRGYGHGVGLSQYGAQYRAKAGQTYKEILQFYYPGALIVKEYSEAALTDPVAISSVSVKPSYSTEKAAISYKISGDAKVTVTVKNSQGKVVATLANQTSYKKGSHTASWNFIKNSDGTYKVTILAKNSSNVAKSVTKTFTIKRTKGKVTATSLNIREKKSTASKRIGILKKNQIITILVKEKYWYKIKTSTNKIGYASAKYITVIK